jgi:hypothetical protein
MAETESFTARRQTTRRAGAKSGADRKESMDKIVIITSCGKKFEMLPSEMTERQLRGLTEQNADRDVTALREELARRQDSTD